MRSWEFTPSVKMGPVSRRIVSLLASGPMTKDELVSEVYRLVPPGRGSRRYYREHQSRQTNREKVVRVLRTEEEAVVRGQLYEARHYLSGLVQKHNVAIEEINGEEWCYLTAHSYLRSFTQRRADAEDE